MLENKVKKSQNRVITSKVKYSMITVNKPQQDSKQRADREYY
jgi:hypothetical protein